jgi:hypothetical protein
MSPIPDRDGLNDLGKDINLASETLPLVAGLMCPHILGIHRKPLGSDEDLGRSGNEH